MVWFMIGLLHTGLTSANSIGLGAFIAISVGINANRKASCNDTCHATIASTNSISTFCNKSNHRFALCTAKWCRVALVRDVFLISCLFAAIARIGHQASQSNIHCYKKANVVSVSLAFAVHICPATFPSSLLASPFDRSPAEILIKNTLVECVFHFLNVHLTLMFCFFWFDWNQKN